MVSGKSALLEPLTQLISSNAAFVWTSVESDTFEEIMKVLAKAVLLSFPDFTHLCRCKWKADRRTHPAARKKNFSIFSKPYTFTAKLYNQVT